MCTARRLVAVMVAAICVLVLSACGSPKPTSGGGGLDPALRGAWTLTSARDAGVALPLLHQNISLTVSASGNAVGRASCADYTATIYGSRTSLWISPSVPPATLCTFTQLAFDRDYFAALKSARQFSVHGTTLELTGRGMMLRYRAAVNPLLTGLVDQRWRLNTVRVLGFQATAEKSSDRGGGVVIFGSSGLLTAQTKCATYLAHYTETAGVITVTNLGSTPKTLCTNFPLQPDYDFENLVRGGFTFTVKDEQMTLTSQRAGLELGFVPDWNQ